MFVPIRFHRRGISDSQWTCPLAPSEAWKQILLGNNSILDLSDPARDLVLIMNAMRAILASRSNEAEPRINLHFRCIIKFCMYRYELIKIWVVLLICGTVTFRFAVKLAFYLKNTKVGCWSKKLQIGNHALCLERTEHHTVGWWWFLSFPRFELDIDCSTAMDMLIISTGCLKVALFVCLTFV